MKENTKSKLHLIFALICRSKFHLDLLVAVNKLPGRTLAGYLMILTELVEEFN